MKNNTILQYFHWYSNADGNLWNEIAKDAANLAKTGITAVWLPPAFKANDGNVSTGYDVYDIYDLGEFDQKGTVRTKYGTKDEYIACVKSLQQQSIAVYVDIVLNHKAGGDETEVVHAKKVNENNRLQEISEPIEIEAFTIFNFSGRQNNYSDFKWNHQHFTGVDFDNRTGETGVYSILNDAGESWEDMIDDEKGNYDYLMYSDVEFRNPEVREELNKWGDWYRDTVHFDGVRLDAVKHIPPYFYNDWLNHMRAAGKPKLFAVGEYWAPGDLSLLQKYIVATERKMSLFDSCLQKNFHEASNAGSDYDMTTIFNDTLTATDPLLSVTVVDNHDTQPLQSLEAPVEAWFKPIAYALILLRKAGYPCVFYPDMVGTNYKGPGNDGNEYEIHLPACEHIHELLKARENIAYGEQHDYLDHNNCIGWTREGSDEMEKSSCAILLSNGDEGEKKMYVGKKHVGKIYTDLLKLCEQEIQIDENGEAVFYCTAGSVSVWALKN